MKVKDFEDFLIEIHAKQYHGLDDDMPDAFNDWLSDLSVEEWLGYGDQYKKGEEYGLKS